MKTIRAFFAITLAQVAQDAMSTVLTTLKQSIPSEAVRWTEINNLHITLQFLPRIQPNQVAELVKSLSGELQNTPAFLLDWGNITLFPNLSHPRIIALEVEPSSSLEQLATTIKHKISALGYPVETRPFRGHLTLGRLRNTVVKQAILKQIKVSLIPSTTVSELYLFESKSNKEGSNYLSLAQFSLKSD